MNCLLAHGCRHVGVNIINVSDVRNVHGERALVGDKTIAFWLMDADMYGTRNYVCIVFDVRHAMVNRHWWATRPLLSG